MCIEQNKTKKNPWDSHIYNQLLFSQLINLSKALCFRTSLFSTTSASSNTYRKFN
jgi:hypothetical protein